MKEPLVIRAEKKPRRRCFSGVRGPLNSTGGAPTSVESRRLDPSAEHDPSQTSEMAYVAPPSSRVPVCVVRWMVTSSPDVMTMVATSLEAL